MLEFINFKWPDWIQNLSTLASIFGFIISVGILFLTNSIKTSFTRKARVPEILKELENSSEKIGKYLKDWEENKNNIEIEFSKIRGNLQNLSKKLDKTDKKKINVFIKFFYPRKLIFKHKIDLTEDISWKIFTELSELITYLVQLNKDLKWM